MGRARGIRQRGHLLSSQRPICRVLRVERILGRRTVIDADEGQRRRQIHSSHVRGVYSLVVEHLNQLRPEKVR